MTASSSAVRSVEHQPNLNEVLPNSAAYVIDFFEARHRLLTESKRIAQESEIDRQIQEPAIRRERSVGLVDALEEAFYWLILAAAPHIWPLGSSAFETNGIGFAVESEGLHSSAWRGGQPGDAF
jgi:hypothetical protein